jgi:hypothetical protein
MRRSCPLAFAALQSLRIPGLILIVSLVLAGESDVALADPAKATAYFERGTRLYQVGDYGQAIEQFKAGHIEEPDASFVFNIAQCHRQLGHTNEALIAYRRFLTMDPETSLRADVERKIAALEEQLKREARVVPPIENRASVRSPIVRPASRPVDLAARSPTAQPPSKPGVTWRRWPLWLGGATLAFAGSATILGVSTNNRFDRLRTACGRQSGTRNGCPEENIEEIRTRARVINVLWALAGLSAMGTGASVYFGRDRAVASLALSF